MDKTKIIKKLNEALFEILKAQNGDDKLELVKLEQEVLELEKKIVAYINH